MGISAEIIKISDSSKAQILEGYEEKYIKRIVQKKRTKI